MATADRFIPVRSAIDWGYALDQLTNSSQEAPSAPSAYGELLSDVLLDGRRRLLAFNNIQPGTRSSSSSTRIVRKRTQLVKPRTVFKAFDFVTNPSLNLLDWGSQDIAVVAIDCTVSLWAQGLISELVTVDEDESPVSSIKWAPDGETIALGLSNSEVELWQLTASGRGVWRILRGHHLDNSRIGAIDWNGCVITTGGQDGKIVTNDVRLPTSCFRTYSCRGGRNSEICSLKWNNSGRMIAGGSRDGLVCIWDAAMDSKPCHILHTTNSAPDTNSAFGGRALDWCPFKDDLLATAGEGSAINFWNTCSGTLINSSSTDNGVGSASSQVSSLLWNKNTANREILCASGNGEITLLEYPSMAVKSRLVGHTSPVLSLCRSPDGCSVASVSGGRDESVRIWRGVFPPVPKPKPAPTEWPFSNSYRSDIR